MNEVFDPVSSQVEASLDAMEKNLKMATITLDKNEPRIPTGLLSLDLILAGGLVGGGWYTFFGGEQSCKTTGAYTLISSIVQNDFKNYAAFFDYEGSGSAQVDYIENISDYMSRGKGKKAENIFGIQDEKTGDWIIKPIIRYYSPSVGEKLFDYIAWLEKKLPDKLQIQGEWFYLYEHTKENKALLKGHYDTAYLQKRNKLRVPAPNGNVQAIVVVDSYPAMNPKQSNEKEEGDKSLAGQARMFSEGLKRIKSDMRKKRILVVGINQLRSIPMAMYGPTEQEPCGNSLKFYSDVRIKTASISLSTAGVKGKGAILEEESVVGDGYDSYRFIKMTSYKNKLGGRPHTEIILRLVVENARGQATGFCKTWDIYTYLKMTGQVSKTKGKLKFKDSITHTKRDSKGKLVEETLEFKTPLVGLTLTWLEFKTIVEGEIEDAREVFRKHGLNKSFNVREGYLKQLRTKGLEYYKAQTKAANSRRKKPVEESED